MRKNKAFILALSLGFMVLTASNACADTWEVYTYDSGNFLARIFNALAIMTSLGDDGAMMRSLIKIAALSGLLMLLLSFLSTRIQHQDPGPDGFVHMLKQVLLTAIATWVLMVPKSNVLIVDRADPSQTQPVSDVPFATVIVAHFSSVLGDAIGQTIEDLLTDVDAIKFKNGGMALGARYLNEILDIDPPAAPAEYKVPNEYVPINMVLGEYFTRCVFPQFFSLPGDTSIQAQGMRTLMTSPFLLTAFTNSIFRNKNTVFNNQFTEGEFPDGTTCYNAPGQILDKWTNVFTPWLSRFNYKIFGNDTLDPGSMDKAQAVFARYFGWSSISDWQQNVMQIATLNAVRSEILCYQQSFSGASGAEEMMKKKTGEGWIFAAKLFNKIIITMRQLAEALVYAAALFLPVLFVIGGMNALFHYIKTHIWLQLWVPIFVLLNAFADYQLVRIVEAALNNPDIPAESLGISFQNLETLRTHANLILGYIGAFSWSVPTLAWGLVKGGEYAMTQAVSALSSGAAGHGEKTAQAVGSERGGGGRPEMPSFRNPTYGQFELSGNYAGAQARGYAAIRQQRLFETFGDRGLTQAAESSIAGGIGTHQGMGGARGIMETSAGTAERKKADWEAFKKEAQDRGFSSPGEMARVFSQMDYGQKAQAIDDMAQKNNTSKEEAAQTLANATGDRHFLEAVKVSAGAREAGGVQSLASLTEARAEIDTSAQRSAIDTIRSNGFTPSDFGGQQGFMEAVRTLAAMEAIKGGKLTNSELKASMETGILSEVGRNQAIDQASKT